VIFSLQGQLNSDCDFWFARTITIQIVILVCKYSYNSYCDFWFARTVKIQIEICGLQGAVKIQIGIFCLQGQLQFTL